MEEQRKTKPSGQKKKHSAIRKIVIAFWCLLFLCIGISISFLLQAIEKKSKPTHRSISVSPTPECVAKACVWLSGVDDTLWNYETVSTLFADLTVEVTGDYNSDEAAWQWTVSEESYVLCEAQAYERLGDFFTELIIKQGELEPDITEQVTDLLGMPMPEYLKTCDIDLMPAREELISKVSLIEQGGENNEK